MKSLFQNIVPEMICAVVVAYEPDDFFKLRLNVLSPQLGKVVVVDNSSKDSSSLNYLKTEFRDKVFLINNGENLGLGYALNQGVKEAKKLGFSFVILFDQDSEVFPNTIFTMCSIANKIKDNNLALLGASYKKLSISKKTQVQSFIKKKSNITSGSILPISIFEKVGLFRSDYFIDCIDSEFSFRLRKNGYSIYQTSIQLMKHAIGNPVYYKFLGCNVLSTNHSDDRRYYIARNHLVMLREYSSFLSKIPCFWLFKTIKRSVYFSLIVILYENEKLSKIKAIASGVKDGFLNKMGKRL
jgi:rhamnosyltransferase